MYFLKAIWPRFNFEITFFSLLFMIFDLRLLSSVLLLHSQIELIGPFDEFFQPWIDCIGICLFGWRSNGIFIQKLIFLEVVCFATPHMAISLWYNCDEFWLQWRRPAATLNFWMGLSYHLNQSAVCLHLWKLNALISMKQYLSLGVKSASAVQ